jgi:beta-glucosidase/6-phospho-beta-glucosidase/beta-galactosidase
MIITENGISKEKCGDLEEERKDEYRIDYMREHLRSAARAIHAGAPLKGYFPWSVMDTNELRTGGYKFIFGLTQVDYETKARYRRDSWYYYQKVIADCEVD